MTKTGSFLALTFAAAFASAAWAQETQTQPPAQPQDPNQPAAQGQRGGGQRSPEAELKNLKEKLALTEDQATKIEAILKDRGKEMTAAREKAGTDREAARAAGMEIRKTFDTKIDAVLTAEQKTKMEALREEQRKAMENRRPPSNPQ